MAGHQPLGGARIALVGPTLGQPEFLIRRQGRIFADLLQVAAETVRRSLGSRQTHRHHLKSFAAGFGQSSSDRDGRWPVPAGSGVVCLLRILAKRGGGRLSDAAAICQKSPRWKRGSDYSVYFSRTMSWNVAWALTQAMASHTRSASSGRAA